MSSAGQLIHFDLGAEDAIGRGRLVPFRLRSDELTMAQAELAVRLSNYRLPNGLPLKRLLSLLERDELLRWAVLLVAEQLPRSVIKIVDVGIQLEEFQDGCDSIIWVEAYTTAEGAEAAISHQEFVRKIIVRELYARGVYRVSSAMKFV